jgi:colanic acid biosynthesis glycosyl transferase WcaI
MGPSAKIDGLPRAGMRIHLVTNLFAPDELAGAALYTDLAFYLRERGHDVRVTSTFPYYPEWELREGDIGVKVRDESIGDLPVRRVSMYVPRKATGATRMLSDFTFLKSLLLRGRHPGWKPDVVLTALPMLSQCLAQRLSVGRRVPCLIVVQDFVVDAALELGILKLPGFAGVFKRVEKYALGAAGTIVTISPGMLEKVRQNFPTDGKVRTRLIPNWIHGSLQAEIHRQVRLRRARERMQLFYSGNLGVKQGLPDFLADFGAASGGWKLRIHGGGTQLDQMREAVKGQAQISLGGTLEESAYIAALLSTSACLVTQRPGVGANFLPSKLLPALATGTPVLAVCDEASPLACEVREGNFGTVVAPGDRAVLAATLRQWAEDETLLARMAENALLRAARYSRETVLPLYEEELLRLAE